MKEITAKKPGYGKERRLLSYYPLSDR